MKIEKPNLAYWSPLPPKKGGFFYREQHAKALIKHFNVYPIDMTGSIQSSIWFILLLPMIPFMLLFHIFGKKRTEYVEYDFAAYKSPLFFPLMFMLGVLIGSKMIFRLHEDYQNKSYGWLIRLYDNFWLWLCADIILVHTYEHAELLWRVNRQKATVMLSGLEVKQHKAGPKKNIIILPGFINTWKGHDLLLDALIEVRKMVPSVKLIIAGKVHDDVFFETLKTKILYSDLVDNVELHTEYLDKKHMNALLSRATLAVLPYRRINFSAALLDCVDWEIPTIVSNIPQFNELCPQLPKFGASGLPNSNLYECDGNHEDCWCVKPSHLLAEKIIELLKDHKKLLQVKGLMKDLKKKYDIQRIAKEEAKILSAELSGGEHEKRHGVVLNDQ